MTRACVMLAALLMATGCGSEPAHKQTPSATAGPAAATASSAAPSAQTAASARAPNLADARPLYYEREITADDLTGRTLRELSLLRNTIFARAGNTFRRPWLAAYFGAQAWYKPAPQMDDAKLSDLDRKNARIIADHDAALATSEFEKRRDELLGRQASEGLTQEDEVELSLLSQRLGSWLGDASAADAATPLENHARLDTLLRVEDLSTLSLRDLRILRNTIYARKGRTFDSDVVRGYFKNASWYKPRADYSESLLSEVDQKNIGIIRSVEKAQGGPLHENPDYGKEGWFILA